MTNERNKTEKVKLQQKPLCNWNPVQCIFIMPSSLSSFIYLVRRIFFFPRASTSFLHIIRLCVYINNCVNFYRVDLKRFLAVYNKIIRFQKLSKQIVVDIKYFIRFAKVVIRKHKKMVINLSENGFIWQKWKLVVFFLKENNWNI